MQEQDKEKQDRLNKYYETFAQFRDAGSGANDIFDRVHMYKSCLSSESTESSLQLTYCGVIKSTRRTVRCHRSRPSGA